MLDNANKYSYDLNNLFLDTWYDDKYKYYYSNGYSDELLLDDSNFMRRSFVSLDNNGNILGYIDYHIKRYEYYAYAFNIINFSNDIGIGFFE